MKKLLSAVYILLVMAGYASADTVITGGGGTNGFGTCVTVANLPSSPVQGQQACVTDGNAATDCTTGSGSTKVTCWYNGATWVSVGVAGASTVSDAAYGAAWDGDTTNSPSKNAVYDKMEAMVPKSLYDANTILYATTDNTPAALTVAEDKLVGRASGGAIAGIGLGTGLSITGGNLTIGTLNQNTSGTAANVSGTPALPNGTTATTQSQSDNSTKLATTAYVDTGLGTKASATLADGKIYAGNGSNVASAVTPSGDVTMTNAGAFSIGSKKVAAANIADNTITASQIAAALTFADGDSIDLSGITPSNSVDEGLALPNWANVTPTSDKNWITVDRSANAIKYYNGGWVTVTPSGAPTTSKYLTLGYDATLSNEELFTPGVGLTATDGGANSTYGLAVTLNTLVDNQTLWDGTQASRTLTANLSGTDPVLTFSSGVINVSTGALQVGGAAVATTGGNIATATALAANGSNCSAGQFPLGVDASGAAESCTALPTSIAGTTNQINASASTGSITLSFPAGGVTLPGTTTGTFSGNVTGNVTGNVSGTSGSTTGNAATATALAANGSNCSAGYAPLGVDASGAVESCWQPSPLAGSSSLTTVGTVANGTWSATAIGNTKGGTGQDSSSWTGLVKATSGTWATATAGTDYPGLASTNAFTGNNTFGDADTDTLTLRSLLVGGNSRAVWIAGSAPTPTYATGTNELYVAGDIEAGGTVYGAAFVSTGGTDGNYRLESANNTTRSPAASEYSLYFEAGTDLKFAINGSEKTAARLEDAQTFTGAKTFTGGLYSGDASTAASLRLYDGSSNYWTITAPSMSSNYTLTLPADDGNSGQLLSTDGSGTLSWVSSSSSVAGSDTQVQFNDSSAFGGDAGLTYNKTTQRLTIGKNGTGGGLGLYNELGASDYTATIIPNAGQAAAATITLPPATAYLTGGNVTLAGPTSTRRTWTGPDADATLARTDAGQTFTGVQAFTAPTVATSITPNTAANATLGTAALPFSTIIFAGTSGTPATNHFTITGASTGGNRTLTLADGDTTLVAGTMLTSAATIASLSASTSANLSGVLSDETGTGSAVFGTGPSITPQVIDCHANCSPTAAQLSNATVQNYGQSPTSSGTVTITGPTVAAGMNFMIVQGTDLTSTGAWAYTSNTSNIYIDNDSTARTTITFTAQPIGSGMACRSFQTGASTYSLKCTTLAGTRTAS